MSKSLSETSGREGIGARGPSPPPEPGLYVVATPIGNLRDISLRALDILGGASRLYAEDTRVARKLLDAYGLKPRLGAYHDHSDESARREILEALAGGESVALISDAGTPLISDPGFKLVRAAIEAGFKVFPIPGASAALAGLVVSGMATDRFMFLGFLPAKQAGRRAALEEAADIDATLVVYESGPRLADSLADMADILGNRPAAVARELTKLFEETRRDTLAALAAHYSEAGPPKGEIVVVIGPPLRTEVSDDALDAFLAGHLAGGVRVAASEAARALGVSRKRAYARALALRDKA
ncbi:MAG: 16S rRNA (cytidine(1402)-2'-O)-methyltransferase [Terricaulis sp.]